MCFGVMCIATTVVSAAAFAHAGLLDTTFANKGIFSDDFSGATGTATALALQSDGKILVGGSDGSAGVVLRLTSNGTIDNSFGTAGILKINFRVGDNAVTGLAVQTDGKIVVAGAVFQEAGAWHASMPMDNPTIRSAPTERRSYFRGILDRW
jgi:uncharacterized delta-60 repeat protein